MELLELWGAARGLDPAITAAIREADERLSDAVRDLSAFDTYIQSRSPTKIQFPPVWEWQEQPGIAGIWGIGLWLRERGGELLPALFVDSQLGPYEGARLRSDLSTREALERRMQALGLPPEIFELDLWIVGRDALGLQHCNPSDEVRFIGARSTSGCRVTLANKRLGITSAGHGAPTVGSTASVGAARIGRVVDTVDPRCRPAGTAEADIALIELDRNHQDGLLSRYFAYATVVGDEDLIVNVQVGPVGVWARATMPNLRLNRKHAGWGNVVETDRCVTQDGDSGAPVELSSNPGHLVGHVVGADAVRTVVQDLDYQLRRFNAQLRP